MNLSDIQKQAYETATEKGFHDSDCEPITSRRAFPGHLIGRMFTHEKLMLIVTEVAEATEAVRHRDFENFQEELADIIIRVADMAEMFAIDLELAVIRKMKKNKKRKFKHGKAC